MTGIADKVVVVTQSSKFEKRAFSRYAGVEAIHVIVTDSWISPQDKSNLQDKGVKVIIAE